MQSSDTQEKPPGGVERFRPGVGNWAAFTDPPETVLRAAESWRRQIDGIARPWLCWNVDSDWCLLQQRLVLSVGWTPVVGTDPRLPRPGLAPGAVFVDFNAGFDYPAMRMHFPIEFAFAFAPRLAFWHSDLLVRPEKMRHLAAMFDRLEDGQMAAVAPNAGLRAMFQPRLHRYWELVGCTTRAASRSQFEHGCGWWMNFHAHPNCPSEAERERRRSYSWTHGVGTKFWERHCGGTVVAIEESYVDEGHCTAIGNKNYRRLSPDDATRFMTNDLRHNFDLAEVSKRLGLESLLHEEL